MSLLAFALWPLAFALGCHNCDRVEQELRAKDTELREMRELLERSDCYNKAMQADPSSVRGDYCPFPGNGTEGLPPLYPIRSLTLGRQTGGYDTTNCSTDDALQVVLEPRDCDNHAIKVPASALIQALEITPEGLKHPLSTWEINPDQLAPPGARAC